MKLDIADGFYRIKIAPQNIPCLGVIFPNKFYPTTLVALPLVLPVGWVNSLPAFCAATETAAHIANTTLQQSTIPHPHPLSTIAPSIQVTGSTEHLLHLCSQPPNADGANGIANPVPTLQPDPFIKHHQAPLAYIDMYMDDYIALAQPTSKHQV